MLGHSYGGLVAMEYSFKYPKNVEAMILANTPAATLRGNQKFMKEFRKRISTVKGSIDPTKPLTDRENMIPLL